MLVLEISRLASDQPPVVDEAATAERLSKDDLLLCSRIEAILVGPLRLCTHDLCAFLLLLHVRSKGSQNFAIERAIILFCYLSYLFQQRCREPDGQGLDLSFHIAILTLNWLHIKGLRPQGHQFQIKERRFYSHSGFDRGFTRRFDKQAHNQKERSADQFFKFSASFMYIDEWLS